MKEVRWRQAKGGCVWAKPRGLKAGTTIRRAGLPLPGRIFITIQGTFGTTTHEHLRQVMSRVETRTGLELIETPPGDRLMTGHWSIDEDPAGNATGHIEILTASKDQAEHCQQTLANVAVEIQHEVIPLQVTGDALAAGSFRRMQFEAGLRRPN